MVLRTDSNALLCVCVCVCVTAVCLIFLYNKYLAHTPVCVGGFVWGVHLPKDPWGHLENVHARVCSHVKSHTRGKHRDHPDFYKALACSLNSSKLSNHPGHFSGLRVTGTDVIYDIGGQEINKKKNRTTNTPFNQCLTQLYRLLKTKGASVLLTKRVKCKSQCYRGERYIGFVTNVTFSRDEDFAAPS